MVTWRPLNLIVTDALRATLSERVRHHPTFVRYARRVGVVEAALPNGRVLRMSSGGDDDIAGPLFWRGWAGYEPETSPLFYELARSARVTLDIGAHVGYFALLAALANARGRVYAFEPQAMVHARLARNVALSAAPNITCLPLAAGSPAGTAEFFHVKRGVPTSSSLSQSFMRSVVSNDELTSSTVEVVEIDRFVEAHDLTGVDLVKIDTETTESAVVRGMMGTVRRDRPDIFCEVLRPEVGAAIEALLKPLDYEFFLLTAAGPVACTHISPNPPWLNFVFRSGPAR